MDAGAAGEPRVIRAEDGAEVSRQQLLEWELMAGRRLIRLLRQALGSHGLLTALRPYLEESTRRMSALVKQSGGQWRRATIRVQCDGLWMDEFFGWWDRTARSIPELFLTANAEHVTSVPAPGSRPGIVEPMGGLPAALFFRFGPGQGIDPVDATYPRSVIGAGRIGAPDGPVAARCIHHFRDTEAGMTALLTLEVPAAAPETLVEELRQHLAIEFSRFMTMAKDDVRQLPGPEEMN